MRALSCRGRRRSRSLENKFSKCRKFGDKRWVGTVSNTFRPAVNESNGVRFVGKELKWGELTTGYTCVKSVFCDTRFLFVKSFFPIHSNLFQSWSFVNWFRNLVAMYVFAGHMHICMRGKKCNKYICVWYVSM